MAAFGPGDAWATTMTEWSTERIQLVVLDMAGTTVADSGLAERALSRAAGALGVEPGSTEHVKMAEHVRATLGESEIGVFRELFGDEERARRADAAFEDAYRELLDAGGVRPVLGAREAIERLRDTGRKVVLCTGLSRAAHDALLDALGWLRLADLTLCPADAGRGRPYPDLVLTAVLRTRTDSVRQVAVVGDTAYDMTSGRRAGAAVVAGVLTGAHDEATLRDAGATHVIDSVTDLPDTLEGPGGMLSEIS